MIVLSIAIHLQQVERDDSRRAVIHSDLSVTAERVDST